MAISKDDINKMQEEVENAAKNIRLTIENYRPLVQIFTDGEEIIWEAVPCSNCKKPALLHGDEDFKETSKIKEACKLEYRNQVSSNRVLTWDFKKFFTLSTAEHEIGNRPAQQTIDGYTQ